MNTTNNAPRITLDRSEHTRTGRRFFFSVKRGSVARRWEMAIRGLNVELYREYRDQPGLFQYIQTLPRNHDSLPELLKIWAHPEYCQAAVSLFR